MDQPATYTHASEAYKDYINDCKATYNISLNNIYILE